MIAFCTMPSSSAGWTVERPPPRRPIGVRTASTMTTERSLGMKEPRQRRALLLGRVLGHGASLISAARGRPRGACVCYEASVFEPRSVVPDEVTEVAYFHVIGTSVWATRRRRRVGPRHVVGMLDGACWAVDVPPGADPPTARRSTCTPTTAAPGDGVARRRPRGAARRVGPHASLLRSLRDADRAGARRAGDAVPGVRAAGLPPARAGDDHARHPRRRRPEQAARSPAACSGRRRCTPASPASSSPARRSRARSSARSTRRSASIVGDVRYSGQPAVAVPAQPDDRVPRRTCPARSTSTRPRSSTPGWYRRDALPIIPPAISIARKLIDAWVAGEAAASRRRSRG